jgi:hypothetical protein
MCICPAQQVVQLAGGIRKVVPTVAGGAAPPASSKPAAPAAAINPLIAAAQAAASKLAAQARCQLPSPRSIAFCPPHSGVHVGLNTFDCSCARFGLSMLTPYSCVHCAGRHGVCPAAISAGGASDRARQRSSGSTASGAPGGQPTCADRSPCGRAPPCPALCHGLSDMSPPPNCSLGCCRQGSDADILCIDLQAKGLFDPTLPHYEADLEINDFPQHARWKASPQTLL